MADNVDQDPKPTGSARRRRRRRGSEAPRNSESERAQPSVASSPASAGSDDLPPTDRSSRRSAAEFSEPTNIDVGTLEAHVSPKLAMVEIFTLYERNLRDYIGNALYDEFGDAWLTDGVLEHAFPYPEQVMKRNLAEGKPYKGAFGIGDFEWIIKRNKRALPLQGQRDHAMELCAKIRRVRNDFLGHDNWNRNPSPEETEELADDCASMLYLCARAAQVEDIRQLLKGHGMPQYVGPWLAPAQGPGPSNAEMDASRSRSSETQSEAEGSEQESDPAPPLGGSKSDPERSQQRPDESPRPEAAAAVEQLGSGQRALADAGEVRRIGSPTQGGSYDGGGGPGAATLAGAGDDDRSPPANEGGASQGQRVRRWLRQHPLLAAFAALAIPAIAAIIVFVALDQAGVFSPTDLPPPPPIIEPPSPPSKPGQEEQEQPATTQKEQEQEEATTQEEPEEPDPEPAPDDPPPPSVLTSLSVGAGHSCRLTANGAAACWGSDGHGRIRVRPGKFTAISAGGAHTCGLRENGTASCWGWNGWGQTSAPEDKFSSISAGLRHNCGITVDNTIRCWGSNEYGQRADQLTSEFTAVSAGYYHNCAIRTSGDVVCWGFGDNGQTAAPAGPFTAVSAGFTHTCGLRPSGNIECWGEDKAGETQAPPTDRFVAVSAGQLHSCGILESGAVRCWGSDEHGRATPPEGKFVSVDAGELHTCATRDDGSVTCWGDNSFGQRDVAAAVVGDHEAPPDDPTSQAAEPTTPDSEPRPQTSEPASNGSSPSTLEDEGGRTQPAASPGAAGADEAPCLEDDDGNPNCAPTADTEADLTGGESMDDAIMEGDSGGVTLIGEGGDVIGNDDSDDVSDIMDPGDDGMEDGVMSPG